MMSNFARWIQYLEPWILNGQIVVSSPEGRRIDILKLHVDELEMLDESSVAEGAGLDFVDRRVADDHSEDGHGAEGVPAYNLGPDVVHSYFRDGGRKYCLG